MKLETNLFKKDIVADRARIGIWSSLCSPIAADILTTSDFDWALIDMEHSANELASVLAQLQVYRGSPVAPVVRPPWNDPVIVKRLLDIGSETLLFPMVRTAEEAEAAVRACRYPPRGMRGVALMQRANRYALVEDYLDRCEEEICVLVQIETCASLERVEEIAATEGVDGVFFGPADLSADMDLLGKPSDPAVTEAIVDGVERVRAVGKPTGILAGSAEEARNWLEIGALFVACGSDLAVLARGARALRQDIQGNQING